MAPRAERSPGSIDRRAKHWSLRATILLLGGAALFSCAPPRRAAATAAGGASPAAPAPDSAPWYLDTAESCGFVTASRSWTPSFLVRAYVTRDSAGDFLATDPWLDSTLTCYGHMPGWDAATIVAAGEIRALDSTSDQVRFTVAYRVVGTAQGGLHLLPVPRFEVDTFVFVATKWGWRMDGPYQDPHVSPAVALRSWRPVSVPDSLALIRLVALGATDDSVPRATLVVPGIPPQGPLADGPWLGLYEGAHGSWSLRQVRIGERNTFDACLEDSVAVPRFDPDGATLAFAQTDSAVPGRVSFVGRGYFVLRPGDSLSFATPAGTIRLRATGTVEDVGTGYAYHDYELSIEQGGRRMRVWRGEFGDEAPKVEWIGDLDGDGFPDLIFSAPTSGYSTATQLLLSRPGAREGAYQVAGEVPITDC